MTVRRRPGHYPCNELKIGRPSCRFCTAQTRSGSAPIAEQLTALILWKLHRGRLARPRGEQPQHLDRQGENDRRILLRANFREGLQITERDRDWLGGDDVSGLR